MIIKLGKPFSKQVEGLRLAQKRRLHHALALFQKDPHNPTLRNHALKGPWSGYRSISFGGDWRAHYKQLDDQTALFVAVGRHSQLYK